MTIKQTLRSLAIGVALCALGASTSFGAQTATGNSVVTVNVPDVIILDYFNAINLTFSETQEAHGDGTATDAAMSWGDGTYAGNALTTSTVAGASNTVLNGGDVKETLTGVWAIRGFSTSGKAHVSISGPTAFTQQSKENSGSVTSSIGVSNILVKDGTNPTALKTIDSVLKGLQKTNATIGDVLMTLNFTNTVASGAHTGTLAITALTY